MSSRKRSGSNSKKTKEKYEVLFKNDESADELSENIMLEIIQINQINLENFESEISKCNFEQQPIVKRNFNSLMKYCIKSIEYDDGE